MNLLSVPCYNVNIFHIAADFIRSYTGPHTAHTCDSHPSGDAISASPLVVMATFTPRYFANIRHALQPTSCSFHSLTG